MEKASYNWFSFLVTVLALLFTIYQYLNSNKIKIGADTVITSGTVKLQLLSRTNNDEFVKIIGEVALYTKDGTPLVNNNNDGNVGIYKSWHKFNRKYEKYKGWQCIHGNDIFNFDLMSDNKYFLDLIVCSKSFAKKFEDSDKIDVSDLYLKIFYQRNHKYLIESKNFSVNEIIEKAFDDKQRKRFYKDLNN